MSTETIDYIKTLPVNLLLYFANTETWSYTNNNCLEKLKNTVFVFIFFLGFLSFNKHKKELMSLPGNCQRSIYLIRLVEKV